MATFDGSRLRAVREKRGLTREQLCVAVGRSFPVLVGWELYSHSPSVESLTRLADALNVSVADFFNEEVSDARV